VNQADVPIHAPRIDLDSLGGGGIGISRGPAVSTCHPPRLRGIGRLHTPAYINDRNNFSGRSPLQIRASSVRLAASSLQKIVQQQVRARRCGLSVKALSPQRHKGQKLCDLCAFVVKAFSPQMWGNSLSSWNSHLVASIGHPRRCETRGPRRLESLVAFDANTEQPRERVDGNAA